MNLNLPFSLVDVFAREPLSGNSLSVFLLKNELSTSAMQRITQEMRQFETIFLQRIEETRQFKTRIFTMEEELSFAGHPIIGAAALLHAKLSATESEAHFEFITSAKSITVRSYQRDLAYLAEMDQGTATIETPISRAESNVFLEALNLSSLDLTPGLPLQVVSTGLPYLIVPIHTNLERAQIVVTNFESLLESVGAKFVYVLDVNRKEGRTWDNDGRVEDIATGSAAGPAAAYLVAHKLVKPSESFVINQGRFLDRASELHVAVRSGSALSVTVSGQVCFVGSGVLELPSTLLQQLTFDVL